MFAGIWFTIINILLAVTTSEPLQTAAGVAIDAIFANPMRRARTIGAVVHINGTVLSQVTRRAETKVTVYTILKRRLLKGLRFIDKNP